MASTARHEREMVLNAKKELNSTKEPLEKLRLQCLQRGVTGIRDFGRQVQSSFVPFHVCFAFDEAIHLVANDSTAYFYFLYFYRTFRVWDDNSDRKISFEEFVKGLGDYGASLNPTETHRLFTSMDKDGSGSIEYEELLIALRVRSRKTH